MRGRWALGLGIVGVLALVLGDARPGVAKPEYTRRTKKECVFCHPKGGYTLNDAGQYYRDHHYSLEGYKPKPSH